MKRRAMDGIETDTASRWARRYLCCFGRPGVARYGKNKMVRRERREAKAEIREEYDDYRYGVDPDVD